MSSKELLVADASGNVVEVVHVTLLDPTTGRVADVAKVRRPKRPLYGTKPTQEAKERQADLWRDCVKQSFPGKGKFAWNNDYGMFTVTTGIETTGVYLRHSNQLIATTALHAVEAIAVRWLNGDIGNGTMVFSAFGIRTKAITADYAPYLTMPSTGSNAWMQCRCSSDLPIQDTMLRYQEIVSSKTGIPVGDLVWYQNNAFTDDFPAISWSLVKGYIAEPTAIVPPAE